VVHYVRDRTVEAAVRALLRALLLLPLIISVDPPAASFRVEATHQ